jgi:5-methylcytosine-specific restriction endonuclease McrA
MQRRTPLQRTGRLPHRSKRTAAVYRTERGPLVAALLAGSPPCQRCMSATATDVHELKTRARGGSITDRENLALLCRPCHTWVTTNPAQALADGWLRSSWD